MKHKILAVLFNMLYHFFSLFYSSKEKKVVFCSNRNEKLSGNLLNLHRVFESDDNYKLTVQCFNFKRSIGGRFIYFFQSIKSIYNLATASLFILDDYFLPVYYIKNKKDRNKVVQVWHAIGHLKKYGLSIEKNKKSPIKHHSNYDVVSVNAPNDVTAVLSSFDVKKEQLLITGAPRLDSLINSPIKQKEWMKKEQFMYAPTYRDATDEDVVYTYINKLILSFIEKSDPSKQFLYISLHPYLKTKKINLNNANNIELFKSSNRSSELLEQIDVLITDYSSILLDYSFFERPILIYAPDYEEYIKKIGFFVNYKEYINTQFYNDSQKLVDNLLNYQQIKKQYVLDLKKDNFFYTDGLNSKRLYNKLNEMMGE